MTVMQTSALDLPRDAWEAHPHWPDQVLLLGSHEAFRHTSATLLRRAERGGDVAGIGWVFSYWKQAMAGHEHYEEVKLYPYLEARWGLSCAALKAGHERLAELDREVRAAVQLGDGEALALALAAHDRALNEHLDVEEELVIPALLALSPDAFSTYYSGDVRSVIADARRRAAEDAA